MPEATAMDTPTARATTTRLRRSLVPATIRSGQPARPGNPLAIRMIASHNLAHQTSLRAAPTTASHSPPRKLNQSILPSLRAVLTTASQRPPRKLSQSTQPSLRAALTTVSRSLARKLSQSTQPSLRAALTTVSRSLALKLNQSIQPSLFAVLTTVSRSLARKRSQSTQPSPRATPTSGRNASSLQPSPRPRHRLRQWSAPTPASSVLTSSVRISPNGQMSSVSSLNLKPSLNAPSLSVTRPVRWNRSVSQRRSRKLHRRSIQLRRLLHHLNHVHRQLLRSLIPNLNRPT